MEADSGQQQQQQASGGDPGRAASRVEITAADQGQQELQRQVMRAPKIQVNFSHAWFLNYDARQRIAEAQELQQAVLVWREAHLGQSHPDTMDTVASLAMILEYAGLAEQVMRAHKTLGKSQSCMVSK
eukprot:COSAG05_NODE_4588_length_1450_cov_1.615100_1_plen_128_part_00